MANILLSFPNWADSGPLYTPTLSGGGWGPVGVGDQFPLTNLKDTRLSRPARSRSLSLRDTRFREDLGVDRQVGVLALPLHNLSSSAKVRFLGVPSTQLFNYEAGDDIAANGGTFTRVPTATVRAATYVDSLGVIQFAGENRCLRSEDFSTTWSVSSVTVSTNTATAPDGATTADTLTATGSNGTVLQSVTTTAVSWTFSVWLKRKTGTGAVSIQVDGSTYVTQTLYTDRWVRCSVTQTGSAGATSIGIKIATSGDAVYAWGAQAEIGSTAKPYLPTTSAMAGAPRDSHYTSIGGSRTILLEGAGTNLCLQSENFGTTWTATGTPTRTAAAHTASGVTLDLIGDDDGATVELYDQPITFTGDGTKALSFFIKQGTSTSVVVKIRVPAVADRGRAVITWSGSVPSVTMSAGTHLGTVALADGVYRILVAVPSVVAADANRVQIYPATDGTAASTGTVYIGGVQVENALAPSSYIPTTTATVTRAKDSLTFPFSAVPQAMTVYVDHVDQGAAVSTDASRHILWLGASGATTEPYLYVGTLVTSGLHRIGHNNTADTEVGSQTSTAATYGQRAELAATLASTGAVQMNRAIDGASFTAATASSAPASGLDAAWAGTTLTVGARADGANQANIALRSIRITAGVQTGAYMQTVVYDSGWVASWPGSATAEDLQGINIAYVAVVATTQAAFRYVSCQISDPSNSAGYVELGRLWVGPRYQPTINAAYGARLYLDDRTSFVDTDGDQSIFMAKSVRRMLDFVLEDVDESEAFTYAWRMQRRLGKSGQLFVIANPDDAVGTLLYERSFLATQAELAGLEYTSYTLYKAAIRLREVL